MEVSVIIPTRNRALVLNQCLQRLVKQIDRGDQVIVVDNGSSDETKSTVSGYLEKFPVKYVFEPRKGPSFARNVGIAQAMGKILAFLDDDCLVSDQWLIEIKRICKLETQRHEFNIYQGRIKHEFQSSNILGAVFMARNKFTWRNISHSPIFKSKRYINFLQAGNFFLRKKVIDDLDYAFDIKRFPFIGEERDLAARLQILGYKIIYTPRVSVTHIKDNLSLSRSLRVAFYYGRAQGILESKYSVPPKIRDLFKQELCVLEKQSTPIKELFTIANHFKSKSLISYCVVLAYLVLRESVFLLGRIYGSVLENFYLRLSERS